MRHLPFAPFAPFAAIVASCVPFVGPAGRAHADPHPHFADRGAVDWTTCLDRARAEARRKGRLILVEYGRRACHSCRVLVEQILPNLRDRLQATCVGLASDCDEPDPRVQAIFTDAMPGATRLPFVAIVTPDLRFVTGWDGGIGADEVVRHLDRCQGALRALSAPAPAPRGVDAVMRPNDSPRADRPPPQPPTATPPSPTGTASGLPVGPSAPRTATAAAAPVATPPAWTAAHAMRATALLASAREASARAAHGTVLGLEAEAAALPVRADPATWRHLVATASAWCERHFDAALRAAREGRCDDAAGLLATVRRTCADGGPVADEAAIGERAIDLARRLLQTPQEERATVREVGRAAFVRTRWAALFAG